MCCLIVFGHINHMISMKIVFNEMFDITNNKNKQVQIHKITFYFALSKMFAGVGTCGGPNLKMYASQ